MPGPAASGPGRSRLIAEAGNGLVRLQDMFAEVTGAPGPLDSELVLADEVDDHLVDRRPPAEAVGKPHHLAVEMVDLAWPAGGRRSTR